MANTQFRAIWLGKILSQLVGTRCDLLVLLVWCNRLGSSKLHHLQTNITWQKSIQRLLSKFAYWLRLALDSWWILCLINKMHAVSLANSRNKTTKKRDGTESIFVCIERLHSRIYMILIAFAPFDNGNRWISLLFFLFLSRISKKIQSF